MGYFNIGGPIALMVLGAILYFALSASVVAGVNLSMVGLILLVAGLAWLVVGLIAGRSARRTVVERRDNAL